MDSQLSSVKSANGHQEARGARSRWLVLAVLCSSLLLIVMDNTILNVALPTLARDLQPTNTQLLWIVDVYSLILAGLLVTFGTLGDRFGRKRFLVAGFVVFGAASAMIAFSASPGQLILGRALLGVGGAMIMPATLSIIRNVFLDDKERAMAIGIWGATASAGTAAGPILSGLLLEWFWWGSVFLINLPVLAVALPLGVWLIPESKNPKAQKWDALSAVVSVAAIIGVVWTIKEAGKYGVTPQVVLAGGASLALLVFFIRRQLRLREPLLDVTLFARRSFSTATLCVLVAIFGYFAILFFLTQHFQFVLGYSPIQAGLSLLPLAIGSAIGSPLTPRITALVGTRFAVAGGLLLFGGALGLFATVSAESAYAAILVALACVGFGVGVAVTAASAAILAAAPPERAGGAAAIQETSFELGGGLGIAVLGTVMAAAYRNSFGAVPGVPSDALGAARDSLATATQVAADLGDQGGTSLLNAAYAAFGEGFGLTMVVGAVVLAVGALLALILLPPGDQSIAADHDH